MSRPQVSWIIRNQKGQVLGPLTTKEVLQRISEGAFLGDEMISSYPQGKWVSISKEPEFYDQLLNVLEKKATDAGYKKPEKAARKEDFEETIIMPRPTSVPSISQDSTKPATVAPKKIDLRNINMNDEQVQKIKKVAAEREAESQTQKNSTVIELKFQDPEIPKKNIRKKIFIIAAGVCFLFFGVMLILPSGKKSDRIRLLRPQANRPALSEQQIREKMTSAIANIELSQTESILLAQNQLISLIEGQPTNLEARGLLCFVYKELWSFTYQDIEDQKTVENLVQATRGLNLTSPHGQLCESIRLLITGRYPEGRAQVDSLLETNAAFSLLPIGYYIKGEILEVNRELLNAASYYEKAGEMWDTWGRPVLALAHLKLKAKQYQEAYSVLQNMNPKLAQVKERFILFGLVEAIGFNKKDSALKTLDAALNQPGRLQVKMESEAWFTLAELWLDKGEKRKALQAAQKSYRAMPQNKLARELVIRLGGEEDLGLDAEQNQSMTMLGDQYMRQGDCLSAQAEYKAAFELNPKNAEAAMKAGKCLWQLNQAYDASEWLNKAIRANPKLITAYVLQADYLSQRYDFQTAFGLLGRAQQQGPPNFEVMRGFAWLEFRKNNMIGAIQYGERAKGLFEGDVETYVLLSRAYRQRAASILPETVKLTKEKEEAIKNMRSYATRAVELDATSTEAQLVYAEMLSAQHGVDTGVQYFNELIKKFSYTLEYRIGLATLLKQEERYNQAKEIFEQVVAVDPKNKRAVMGLGHCQRAIGKNDIALKTFLSAAIIDPSDAEAFYMTGQVLGDLARFDQAIGNYKKAIKINPNYPRLLYAIGQAYFQKGDMAEAKNAALEEKKRNPQLADPMVLLAEVYLSTKQYAECAQEFTNALKVRPVVDLYVKAAGCYRQSGSVEIAQDMLALAKQREDGYADIYKEQGALFQLRGDNEAALESYQMYLELSPNAPDRIQIQLLIQNLGG